MIHTINSADVQYIGRILFNDIITNMSKEIPKSKFKEGEKITYQGSKYSIIKIHNNYYGWQYAIKASSTIKNVDLSVGDSQFHKA
ncbi:MAG: hypothetical protein GW941_00865 [Candidatus Pacebacteria bacterium]|nr:hypothetical protein [Candidatus Paceibacterota bacterium]